MRGWTSAPTLPTKLLSRPVLGMPSSVSSSRLQSSAWFFGFAGGDKKSQFPRFARAPTAYARCVERVADSPAQGSRPRLGRSKDSLAAEITCCLAQLFDQREERLADLCGRNVLALSSLVKGQGRIESEGTGGLSAC
jgi:hypothetical protein